MPATFNKLGLRFTYPENWTIDESEALEGAAAVTVFSPGGLVLERITAPERNPDA